MLRALEIPLELPPAVAVRVAPSGVIAPATVSVLNDDLARMGLCIEPADDDVGLCISSMGADSDELYLDVYPVL